MRKLNNNNSANLGFFIAFVILSSMLIFLFAISVPFLMDFSSSMYSAGDNIIANAQERLDNIDNATVRTRLENTMQDAQDATENNINILGFFYQYGWAFVIIITAFTIFMLARKVVETNVNVV